jgi:hypothetical protein
VTTTSSIQSVRTNNEFIEPELVGLYRADGRYRKALGSGRLSFEAPTQPGVRPAEVPAKVDLHPLEYVVEDIEPPGHAVKAMHGHSAFANLRDGLITFAYGREKSLVAPTHVTTDSKQRLIATDPDRQAMHVLDLANKSSFRIAGGPNRRLRAPAGVAVDADDNIYVADSARGIVLVYDPLGRFLRYLGTYRGESMFQSPAGIAIDRDAGILYVLDPPANELVMINLQGKLLKRVGGRQAAKGVAPFEYPTEIALRGHEIAILDLYGSRIQILDLQCKRLNEFNVSTLRGLPAFREIGLAIDGAENIYISNLEGSDVEVFGKDGRRIGVFGKPGYAAHEFAIPSGLWIDSANRMFVADTRNSRVQVFQVVERSPVVQSAAKN